MASPPDDTSPKLTYEQAIAQVEQIIERIESGEAGLEATLDQYERAVKLLGHCRDILNRVEQRLAELTTKADGRVVIEGELEDDADADSGAGGQTDPGGEEQA